MLSKCTFRQVIDKRNDEKAAKGPAWGCGKKESHRRRGKQKSKHRAAGLVRFVAIIKTCLILCEINLCFRPDCVLKVVRRKRKNISVPFPSVWFPLPRAVSLLRMPSFPRQGFFVALPKVSDWGLAKGFSKVLWYQIKWRSNDVQITLVCAQVSFCFLLSPVDVLSTDASVS